jgi:hypothetical protein
MANANGTGEICPPSNIPEGRRKAALTRLYRWKHHRGQWGELRRRCMSGSLLADLAETGRARPFDLGEVKLALRVVLSRNAVALLEWLYAAQRGFGGNGGGVVLPHAAAARLLACSERTAGDAMRELVACRLVEQRPHFRKLSDSERGAELAAKAAGGRACKHRELVPAYRTTPRCDAAVARRFDRAERAALVKQVGKKFQPPGKPPASPSPEKKGARARWPEQVFVAEMLAHLRPRHRPEAAVVWERLPDGRKAFCNGVTAATVGQRLRTGQGALPELGFMETELKRALRALEERLEAQEGGS